MRGLILVPLLLAAFASATPPEASGGSALASLARVADRGDQYVAVKAGKIYVGTGAVVDNGVILIKNGKIVEVGANVRIPDGAKVVDATTDVVIPGLVNPYSAGGLVTAGAVEEPKEGEGRPWEDADLTGYVEPHPKCPCMFENPPEEKSPKDVPFPGFRPGSGGGGNLLDQSAYDLLDPLDERFVWLQRAGYTTMGIYPTSGLFSGRMVAVKTWPGPRESMAVAKDKVVRMSFRASTAAKEEIRKAFDAAKALIEEEKKAEEAKKKAEEAAKKPKEGEPKPPEPPQPPTPPPAQGPPPPPKKEPTDKEKVAVQILKGEVTVFVEVSSAAGLLHFWHVIDGYAEFKVNWVYVLPSDVYRVAGKIAERKPRAIVAPGVVFYESPFTRDRISPSRDLQKAGAAFAWTPVNDGFPAHEAVLTHAAEQVKFGVTRENALKALTLLPAQMLGVADRVGSLEAGRDGDLVILSGDPFAATTRMKKVLIEGNVVFEER